MISNKLAANQQVIMVMRRSKTLFGNAYLNSTPNDRSRLQYD